MDQCKTSAHSCKVSVLPEQHVERDGDSARLIAAIEASGPESSSTVRTLGYVALNQSSTGKRMLCLKNFGTQMTPDMMTLGYSSKRNNWALAGKIQNQQ